MPVNYISSSQYLTILEWSEAYLIELETQNYVSIIYNNNLTSSNKELSLYTKCLMPGNLTIIFKDANEVISNYTTIVKEDDTILFNYTMLANSSGGFGFLNVTLTNETKKVQFGVKVVLIFFYKAARIIGFTEDTITFSNFFVGAGYIDMDLAMMWHAPINESIITNATVTYEFEGYSGELDYIRINSTLSIYLKVIDLTELQIPAGDYNITFRASKVGYNTSEFIVPITISKANAVVELEAIDNELVIDEEFIMVINVYMEYPHYEPYLRVPVYLWFTVLKDGEIEDQMLFPGVVQSLSLRDALDADDTDPGIYTLNLTIESDYYEGTLLHEIEVVKKELELDIDSDKEVTEDEEFEIDWELEEGDFDGYYDDMKLKVYIDGEKEEEIDLDDKDSGDVGLEIKKPGKYDIEFHISSPYYDAEDDIEIEVLRKERKETWWEQNWLWVILTLSSIAAGIFAFTMLYSRHRIKVQRGLDSELNALKTKINAQTEEISLIEKQIFQIAGIYWILVVNSEAGTTMVEIDDFKFEEVFGVENKAIIGKGIIRDSALIGGFLSAIRDFSRETSGISKEYQPIFSSEIDYTTIIDDNEIHRRILEGAGYFMGFVSARETNEISDVLSEVNSKFHDNYKEEITTFKGRVTVFTPFKDDIVSYLHIKIRELQEGLEKAHSVLENYEQNLNEILEKIRVRSKVKSIKTFKPFKSKSKIPIRE